MKKLLKMCGYGLFIGLFFFSFLHAQDIETIDGVRVVHNGKDGKWGKEPKISLEFVRTIGEVDSDDDNLLFYIPDGIAIDTQGNVFVLDSGNHRIQKFGPDGKYIMTIGNRGQGPGEFDYPLSLDVDTKGHLYVSDPGNQRIQVLKPDGTDFKTIPFYKEPAGVVRVSGSDRVIMGGGGGVFSFSMRDIEENKSLSSLIKILDLEGNVQREFGTKLDYKDFLLNRMGNGFHFAVDKNDNTYVSFDCQNRIEKYSPEGKILWKADRKLNYSTDPPKKKSNIKRSGGRISIEEPQMNRCSSGIAVDGKGRIWNVTLKRQIKEEESVQTNARVMMSGDGKRSVSLSVSGNTDVKKTDMYQLEVYDSSGILLGIIPLNQFVNDIHIEKDRVYLLDKMHGMQYYEYKIIDPGQ